ncbi:MAG: hypothetical protein AAF531_01330 [Actinomycetota bacterium]
MSSELKWRASRALPGDEPVTHAWPGLTGPHPTILSFVSLVLIASIFAHLVLPLPGWWPYGAGALAIAGNLLIAVYQAGSVRIVAVTGTGIHVIRKGRWSRNLTHIVGTMPRMPLGPLIGRWCLLSAANSELWVHHRYHELVEAFDDEYRGRFDTQAVGLQ